MDERGEIRLFENRSPATNIVRHRQRGSAIQKNLNDLVIVSVRG